MTHHATPTEIVILSCTKEMRILMSKMKSIGIKEKQEVAKQPTVHASDSSDVKVTVFEDETR